jgi:hypothetical protein
LEGRVQVRGGGGGGEGGKGGGEAEEGAEAFVEEDVPHPPVQCFLVPTADHQLQALEPSEGGGGQEGGRGLLLE